MLFCTSCGRENPDDARFCAGCGTVLETTPAARREMRKTVTVIFSDVTGSTSLGERGALPAGSRRGSGGSSRF